MTIKITRKTIRPIAANFLLFALLLFAGPQSVWAQDTNPTQSEIDGTAPLDEEFLRPVPENNVPLRDIDPAIWVAKDADTTIYFFGTVHILKPGLGWFNDAVKDAFDASDSLIVEANEDSAASAQAIFGRYAIAQDGIKLRDRLSGDDLKNYNDTLAAAGFPVESFDPLDPWAATTTLQITKLIADGYDSNSGVEVLLEAAAKADGKKIGQVESTEFQLGIFDNLSMEAQLGMLNATTANYAESSKELDRLVDYWGNGDTEKLAQIVSSSFQNEEVYRALLLKRNANWAKWVKGRMEKPGTVFMAVGAGHLAGPVSLQKMLLSYGIEAKRIAY